VCAEASLLKPRAEGVNQHDAKEELDMLYDMLEQPWRTSNQSDTNPTRTEKKLVTFEGIGPTDKESGVPIATRTVSIRFTAVNHYHKMLNISCHTHIVYHIRVRA